MGLADLIKKKVAKGEKIMVDDIESTEKSIGQDLSHLHPNVHKHKDSYQQWAQSKQQQVRIPRGKKVDLIAAHTGSNPLTGLQGSSDIIAMKRIKAKKPKPRPKPKLRRGH